jgi:hypothetical protein
MTTNLGASAKKSRYDATEKLVLIDTTPRYTDALT